MFSIKYVSADDMLFWSTLDKHMSANELKNKIRDKQGYVIFYGEKPIGVMRYNLFWDNTPFLNLIHLEKSYHGMGFGKKAMTYWEQEMRNKGHETVFTSTQSDEQAQHFYRKIGYCDCGCLLLPDEPLEILFIKKLTCSEGE